VCAELAGRQGAVLALHEVEGFRGLHDASQANPALTLKPNPKPYPNPNPNPNPNPTLAPPRAARRLAGEP